MNPVVPKMTMPTMLEMTSAVALKKPICRSRAGLATGVCVLGIGNLAVRLPGLCCRPAFR
jgi:hypothetical protein